ncbi:hypothetical protein ACET3Z_004807 [Daucus carota]
MCMQMGSTSGMMFKFTRPETCTNSNSANDDDKLKDHAEYVAEADDEKNVNEECSVNQFARVTNLKEVCSSIHCPVPTRPRTPRICIGIITTDSEGVDYYRGAGEVIADENGLRKSTKRPRDENCNDQVIADGNYSRKSRKRSSDESSGVCDDGFEEQSLKKKMQQDCSVSQEEKSSKMEQQDCVVSGESSKKKPREYVLSEVEQDHLGSDEDYREENSRKRKQKRVEKKRKIPRKAVEVYNLETDLPQNLKEYIDGLDLEAPPLFVAQKAVEVNVVDDKLRESYGLRLAKWKMTSYLEYALRRGWNTVVEQNNLEPLKLSEDTTDRIVGMKDGELWKTDVVVLAWCFRRESEIWLALHTQAMVELDILGVGENREGKRYIVG